MDKLIKNIPIIVAFCLLLIIWYIGDRDYSNIFIALLCASVIFMVTASVYIVRVRLGMTMMAANQYIIVMLSAGLLTFAVLYASLEYFYS